MTGAEFKWVAGGCHGRAVLLEVALPEVSEAHPSNFSMCARRGYVPLIVPEGRFRLVCGEDQITSYVFNTGVAKHTFCKACGIKSFYRPRSNPNGWSINARCLDEPVAMDLSAFDGQNWESYADTLAHLSEDGA